MVVTYYIKLFQTGGDGGNGILMSLLLLLAETISLKKVYMRKKISDVHPHFNKSCKITKELLEHSEVNSLNTHLEVFYGQKRISSTAVFLQVLKKFFRKLFS